MKSTLITLLSLAACTLAPFARGADESSALSSILVAGDDWQMVSEGHGFLDGPTSDSDGNLYFSDLKSKPVGIYKLTPDGTKTTLTEAARSGLKFGPDGRLYAVGGGKLVVYTLPDMKETVLAEKISTNDLAVNHQGQIYLTETGKKQVTYVNARTGETKAADVGISKPNGIAFSPDQTTLYVSDYGGINVWSFSVQPDGSLTNKKPLMTMKAPEKKPDVAGGDGMICDTAGRAYVTTALGLQIFSANGELLGILPKPSTGPLTSVTFAGKNHDYLYLTCGDKLFRRKTQVKGAVAFEAPIAANGGGATQK